MVLCALAVVPPLQGFKTNLHFPDRSAPYTRTKLLSPVKSKIQGQYVLTLLVQQAVASLPVAFHDTWGHAFAACDYAKHFQIHFIRLT